MCVLLAGVLTLLLAAAAPARVLRVPADYPSIQAACAATAAADTILVAVGVYAESVTAPPLRFVLKGEVGPDTGDYPRPVIDPSTLTNPRQRFCLWLPAGAQAVIEDLVFRNGPAMYPREYADAGGLVTQAPALTLRRCVFDSTHGGIRGLLTSASTLEGCRFLNVQTLPCVWGTDLLATDCVFSSNGSMSVAASGASRFERCVFRDNNLGELLGTGGHTVVHDCIFGPCGLWQFEPVVALAGVFERNVFHEHRSPVQTPRGLFKYAAYDTTQTAALELRDNVFIDNRVSTLVLLQTNDDRRPPAALAVVEDNLFAHVEGGSTYGKILRLITSVDVTGNRFVDAQPLSFPTIRSDAFNHGVATLRHNLFEAGDLALRNLSADTVDAAQNWWGDSTGPYHETLNPAGQGATVDGPAVLSPWHADTTFLSVERPVRAARPQAFTLSAYPNPFNSTVRLRLECADPAIVRVELFDVLGRRSREVWAGLVAGEREVVLDAQTLPSGTYMARATDTIYHRPLATTKLLLVR